MEESEEDLFSEMLSPTKSEYGSSKEKGGRKFREG